MRALTCLLGSRMVANDRFGEGKLNVAVGSVAAFKTLIILEAVDSTGQCNTL